jgi:hypothetical protein
MTRALMGRPIPQDPRAKSVGLLVGPEKRHGRSKFASKIASGDCLRVPSIDDISAGPRDPWKSIPVRNDT